jgi:hypothetical protein
MTKETILASIVRELRRQLDSRAQPEGSTFYELTGGDWQARGRLNLEQLAAAIERDLALKWSSEPPTDPGAYWLRCRRNQVPRPAEVYRPLMASDGAPLRVNFPGTTYSPTVTEQHGHEPATQWAGPIKPPEG